MAVVVVSLQANAGPAPMASRVSTRVAGITASLRDGWKHGAASLDHDLPVHEGVRRAMIREHAGRAERARIARSRSEVGGVPHRGVRRRGVGLGAWIFAVHPRD